VDRYPPGKLDGKFVLQAIGHDGKFLKAGASQTEMRDVAGLATRLVVPFDGDAQLVVGLGKPSQQVVELPFRFPEFR
jgi:hypothetical protein